MLPNLGDKNLVVIAALVFMASLLLLESLYFLWKSYRGQESRKLSRRMSALGGAQAPRDTQTQVQVVKQVALSGLPVLDRWLAERPVAVRLQGYLLQADTRLTVTQLTLASLLTGALAYVLTPRSATLGALPELLAGLAGLALPWGLIVMKRARRLARIEAQLPDALDFIIRALRSGQALTSAIMLAGEEMQEPIASEFRTIHDEITFGESFEQALTNFGERLPLTDLRYFVVSVLVQRDSGGNLSEILDGLSRLIRERYKLMGKIRVLSADGRFSALILVFAPFALAFLMHLTNPKFIALLWTDPLGQSIMKTLGVLMVFGILILRKITRIHV